jgi:hypothetical protein
VTEWRHDVADPGEPTAGPRRLWVVGVLEAASLAVLLVNLVTADDPALAQAVGPVHGLFYLIGIALVWTQRLPAVAKVLVLIPAVGTLLAARHSTRTSDEKRPR